MSNPIELVREALRASAEALEFSEPNGTAVERADAALAELEGWEVVEGHAESFSLDGGRCVWEWGEGPPPRRYQRPALLLIQREQPKEEPHE